MNVDELLRSADPAAGRRLDGDHVETLLASARQRGDTETVGLRPPSGRRRPVAVGAVAAALVGAVVVAVAVASGGGSGPSVPPAVTSAAPSPSADVLADLRTLFAADALVDRARPVIETAGPEGTTVTLWTAPASDGRTCQAVRVDRAPGAPSTFPARPCARPTATHGIEMGRWQWTSPTTGREYDGFWGGTGPDVVEMQLRADDTLVSTTPVVDGLYLTGGVAEDDWRCTLQVQPVVAAGTPPMGLFAFGRSGCETTGAPRIVSGG